MSFPLTTLFSTHWRTTSSNSRWNTLRKLGFLRRSWEIMLWFGTRSFRSMSDTSKMRCCPRTAAQSATQTECHTGSSIDYDHRGDGRPAIPSAVQMGCFFAHKGEVQHNIEFSQQMIFGNPILYREDMYFQLHGLLLLFILSLLQPVSYCSHIPLHPEFGSSISAARFLHHNVSLQKVPHLFSPGCAFSLFHCRPTLDSALKSCLADS